MKVIILGSGISGLSAAWKVHKNHPEAKISLFEKCTQVGGWIQSKQVGPFHFELGPRTFQAGRSAALLELIDELSLTPDLLWSESGSRYLLKNGILRTIPSLWKTIATMIWKDLWAPRGTAEESIASFATRRFGKEGAEQFFDPMAIGVFGGDSKQLSVQAAFPFLPQLEKKYRSLILSALFSKKSDHRLFTLKGGMGKLIQELIRQLPLDLNLESPVEEITPDGIVSKGQFYEADLIISALPVEAIAHLAGEISPVRSETFSVVNIGYLGNVLAKKGYGYLVPSREKIPLMGMIWDTSIFPQENQTKLTAMVRGDEPLQETLRALKEHLKIYDPPDATHITTVRVPQYELGHARKIEAFQERLRHRWPKLILTGNYISGASVNQCILSNSI